MSHNTFEHDIRPTIYVVTWRNPEAEEPKVFHTVCNSPAEAGAFVGQLEGSGFYARVDIYHHEDMEQHIPTHKGVKVRKGFTAKMGNPRPA